LDYRPAPPEPSEIAAGWSSSDFEWIELKNVGSAALDLTGVGFTKGIDFDFPQGYTMPAGSLLLVVKNVAAFQHRHGHDHDAIIVGTFGEDNLSNDGEQVKLSLGAGTPIFDFTYGISDPWPLPPNGAGYTLTLRAPAALQDPKLPSSWRSSHVSGGTPGTNEGLTYSFWQQQYPGLGELTVDSDLDGYNNLLEYALGTHPLDNATHPGPVSEVREFSAASVPGKYLTITFQRNVDAADLRFYVEFSENLSLPWIADAVLVESIPGPDGMVIETWRSATPQSENNQQFARVRVVHL
jgi:hypothetical protein